MVLNQSAMKKWADFTDVTRHNHEKNMEISLRNHSKYLSWLIGEILGSEKLPKFFGDDNP